MAAHAACMPSAASQHRKLPHDACNTPWTMALCWRGSKQARNSQGRLIYMLCMQDHLGRLTCLDTKLLPHHCKQLIPCVEIVCLHASPRLGALITRWLCTTGELRKVGTRPGRQEREAAAVILCCAQACTLAAGPGLACIQQVHAL